MISWFFKNIYASIEIKTGEISYYYPKIPKGFISDLEDIVSSQSIESGLLYIKMVSGQPHIKFKGAFDLASKQRILNCWVVHRAKYK